MWTSAWEKISVGGWYLYAEVCGSHCDFVASHDYNGLSLHGFGVARFSMCVGVRAFGGFEILQTIYK